MRKPAAKPKKPLTAKQKVYVDEKMMGRNPSVILGYVHDCDKSEKVQTELAVQQAELALEVQISRRDVVEGIKSAIDRARMQAEPATEIAGWKEIGKILGHYAPETKKVVLTDEQDKVVRKLESLSTQELLEMVQRKRQLQQGVTVDGTATRIQ